MLERDTSVCQVYLRPIKVAAGGQRRRRAGNGDGGVQGSDAGGGNGRKRQCNGKHGKELYVRANMRVGSYRMNVY